MQQAVESKLKPVTAEELLRMADVGLRRELVRGELKTMAPAGHDHGGIAINVSTPLDQHVRKNDLGRVYAAETGFMLETNPDTVRAPDVAFIRRERVLQVGRRPGYWPGAPDLAVEVVSPSESYSEVEEKVLDWLSAGTRMVVVLDPRKRTATVYRSRTDIVVLTDGEEIEGEDVVPGWRIPVGEIFG